MHRTTAFTCLLLGVLLSSAAGVLAADWPNFRGPNHDGISRESGLRTSFEGGLKPVWERDLGAAFSSFAVVGEKVFTAGTRDGKQVLYCLDAQTGETHWANPFEREYPERMGGDGPRATPTVHDGRVYMLGARGRLICVKAEDGELVWERQLNHVPQWGYSGSVLIEGDMAVVSAGSSDGALLALDRRAGETIWKSGNDPVSYATPYPFTHEGVRYIAGFMGDSAIIVRASDGSLAWRMPWKTDWNVNASAPIYHDGHLLFSSGYRHGAIVLRLRADGDRLRADEVWSGRALRNKFQSCLLVGDYVYTCDETGFKCVEFRTGEVRWHERRNANRETMEHATVAMADDTLFVLNEAGTLLIGKADPSGFTPIVQEKILGPRCWTVAVVSNGRLYARNMDRVLCFDLRR